MLHMQEELMLPCNNSTSCTYSRTLLVEGLIALHTAKQHPVGQELAACSRYS